MNRLKACLITAALLLVALPGGAAEPRISIIIDDLGYQLAAGRRAIALPGAVTFAVLPGAPRAVALAALAHENGKEVLLHLPLQANADKKLDEPIRIDLDMGRQQVAATFNAAMNAVPHAIGVNGHQGSLLTRHPGHMRWLMEAIRARDGLFFVDSYTTARSVAMQVAAETGVAALRRDIFLDPDPDPATVARQFERMKRLAIKRGTVVAIAHPYSATLAFLEKALPTLGAQGIRLVPISELLTTSSAAAGVTVADEAAGRSAALPVIRTEPRRASAL
ncbi:MAG: divergent polysaccharide deacetylase family protein [Woeseiaceae bacterium]|nr:divergent polysaccharide deacetylase family protein [Woeseiaceae bacterium]